jgi:uncharacterized protein
VKKLLIVLCLFLLIAPGALAADLPLVVDDAGLLSGSELTELTAEAERISAEYGMDAVILTVDSIGIKAPRDYAADYYDSMGYGQGGDHSGVMFLLAMGSRDWYILTTGGAIQTFTDYGIEKIGDDIVHDLSDAKYGAGFARFLRDAEIFMKQDAAGDPYDVDNHVQFKSLSERALGALPWLLGASLLVALVGLLILGRGMNTARPQHDANRYEREGSMKITRAGDYFLYHTQTRVKIERNESKGGGSSTFSGSSGTSHGGGGGKF